MQLVNVSDSHDSPGKMLLDTRVMLLDQKIKLISLEMLLRMKLLMDVSLTVMYTQS